MAEHTGIVTRADYNTPAFTFVYICQYLRKVRRTQLRSSAGCLYFFGKSDFFHN
jgi:hypothetical protein